MIQHTPGPWATFNNGHGGTSVVGPKGVVYNLKDADAHLIAAAPDLLYLARNVAGLDSHYLNYDSVLTKAIRKWQKQARAAIKKATGE